MVPAVQAQSGCADKTTKIAGSLASDWNGWSPTPTNTRFQSAAAAGLTVDQVQNLR
jgi:hypothetical protein